jgi:hypothetical protein
MWYWTTRRENVWVIVIAQQPLLGQRAQDTVRSRCAGAGSARHTGQAGARSLNLGNRPNELKCVPDGLRTASLGRIEIGLAVHGVIETRIPMIWEQYYKLLDRIIT